MPTINIVPSGDEPSSRPRTQSSSGDVVVVEGSSITKISSSNPPADTPAIKQPSTSPTATNKAIKKATAASTNQSSSDTQSDMRPKKRERSPLQSSQSLPPTQPTPPPNNTDPSDCHNDDDDEIVTMKQTLEMITRQEALHHVEMAWRAQQRLVRRCLGLRLFGETHQTDVAAAENDGEVSPLGSDEEVSESHDKK